MAHPLKDKAAIVGIGQTEFSRASGQSETALACEAVKNALADLTFTLTRTGCQGSPRGVLEYGKLRLVG